MCKLVSVQDISCYGQCSLTVALPVLSAYGVETVILPSGILSAHTGCFSEFTFLDLTDEMQRIIDRWKAEGLTFDALYTGYIGVPRQFDMIMEMRRHLVPNGQLIVDPAMADHGRLYPGLDQAIVDGMRRLVRQADIILPNLTEAALLLGEPYREDYTLAEYIALTKRLSDLGPSTVILTGVTPSEDRIGAIAYDKPSDTLTEYYVPRQEKSYPGTGDVFSSVVVGKLMQKASLSDALREACDFIVDSIRETTGDPAHTYGVKFERVLAKRMGHNPAN